MCLVLNLFIDIYVVRYVCFGVWLLFSVVEVIDVTSSDRLLEIVLNIGGIVLR